MTDWSTPDDVAAKVRRRWASGALLTAYSGDEPFAPIDVPLRGPRAGEIGDDLGRVQAWIERLDRAAPGRYTVVRRAIGGRSFGRNEIPARAVVGSYAEAWRLLGVQREVASYDEVLRVVAADPVAAAWARARPHAALAVADDWPAMSAARSWLEAHRGSGRYLREISAPGVDTKFVERHRATLAALLDVPPAAESFVQALGLRDRSPRVRVRLGADLVGWPSSLTGPAGLTDATVRLDELVRLPLAPASASVVENEVTFLSVPPPPGGLLFFGEGFRVSRVGSIPWLADVPVSYWGDLDTHGFAILDRLRAWLPQTTSLLMDEPTLLAHRDRWVAEPTPTSASLSRLTPAERSVYDALVTDRYAERVRLEQERVDWGWAMARWPHA